MALYTSTYKSKPLPPPLLLLSAALLILSWPDPARATWVEDNDSPSAVSWVKPTSNDVFSSGSKMAATWSTSSEPVASPSFQLCLAETNECGDTVWPKVKKLRNGQYTINMKIPKIGTDNDFFIRMEDDNGEIYDTPEFRIQAVSKDSSDSSLPPVSPDSLLSEPAGSGSSSSGPDSISPHSAGSGSSNSGSTSSGSNGENKDKSRSGSEGNNYSSKVAGGSPKANSTITAGLNRTSEETLPPITSTTSTVALTPSTTSKSLVGTTGDNKPSAAAIAVPLAIFATALAGLIFSLRQRSKTKEIQAHGNVGRGKEALERTTSKESSASSASGNCAGSRVADLEWAMEFIAGVKVPKSPRLTPLPPSIESKRCMRRENRTRHADVSVGTKGSSKEFAAVPMSSEPAQQQCDHPVPMRGTSTGYASEPSIVPVIHQEGRPMLHAIYPSGLPDVPTAYQPPAAPHVKPLVNSATYPVMSQGTGIYPHALQTPPPVKRVSDFSFVDMPRPPTFMQQYVCPTDPTASNSVAANTLTHPITTFPPTIFAPVPHSTSSVGHNGLQLPPVLPASLRVARPQVPVTALQPAPRFEFPDPPQPQLECQSTASSPTKPNIPYSTRPTIHAVSNPYDAIAKVLRTPRLG